VAEGRRPRRIEIAAMASFLVLAVFVLIQLWIDPNGRVLSANDDDHGVFMFLVGHGDRVLFHGENPFYSYRLNVPDGVNMMANTSIMALSLPTAPITHFFGVGVTIVLLLTLGLAGTAAAWYFVLSRHLVRSRGAAYVGALWCGFAPTMVSHANGHINFVCQFVVPFIVWQVLRLREPGRAVRGGITLAALVVLQAFINEEILLFTALALGVFVLAYAAMAPRAAAAVARPFLAGMSVAATLGTVVLAYPLWLQFFGPGNYHGQPFAPEKYVTDLLSLGAFARQSLAGNGAVARVLSVSATEDNTFFGLPVLLMLVVCLVVLWRSAAAKALALSGLVLLVMSMGPRLRVAGHDTAIRLPFGLISRIPIIDLVSVTRFSMVTATVVGLLLALACDRMTVAGAEGRSRSYPRRTRVAFWAALVSVLIPVAPKPLPIVEAVPPPAFITAGMWRPYAAGDRTVVPVPLPEVTTGRDGMRWAALADWAFAMPRGYFMGPVDPPSDRTGSWAAPRRPTSTLLQYVTQTGRRPVLTAADRRAAVADLVFWRAGVLVLGQHEHADALRATVSDLLGREPQAIGGAQVWDVRDLSAA
jgi:hypothetical protein